MKKKSKTDINNMYEGGIKLKDIVDLNEKIKPKKKINKKKIIIAISISIILLIVAITALMYYSSRDARKFLDKYLFRKNVTQEKLASIDLDYNSNVNILAFNKNICILAENKLMKYNSSGKLENEIELKISNPVYCVNNKYLAISEQNGSKLYVISGSQILWTKDIDGQISKINVNENGYVSVILTGTSYKSVIVIFDKDGNELFKRYLASTKAVDTSISSDNKYLTFAEVNTVGTTITSTVKIVSIENPEEPVIYTYTADSNKLIINIEYNKDSIICMYDDEIAMIKNNNNSSVISLNEKGKNINFANINLSNHVYRAIEENDGLFNTNTILEIKNTENEKLIVYTIEGAAKDIYSYNDIIAVNLGQEIEFLNTSGWLLKRYTSEQEVQNVVIGNGIAGIIYKDKVEFINL